MRSFSRSLLDLYGDYATMVTANLDEAIASSSADAFHDLRVGIKRIRALFELVRAIDPEFPARDCSRELRTLFRPAGAVRDLQVQLELIDALAKDAEGLDAREYAAALLDREHRAIMRFGLQVALFDRAELERFRKRIRRSLRNVDATVARIVAGASLSRDLRAIEKWPEGRDLHELRITAKRAHHNLFMMRQAFPDFMPPVALVDRVDRLQKHLGTWHDLEVVIQTHRAWVERGGSANREATKALHDVFEKAKAHEVARSGRALEEARAAVARVTHDGGKNGRSANPDPARHH